MSDTTRAAVESLRNQSPIVDAVVRQLRRELDGPEGDLASETAELLFTKASPEFLHERSPDALTHLARGLFDFLRSARRNRVDVQVFNPEVENEGWYAPVTVIRTNVGERPFIVDTLREYLHAEGLTIEHFLYPVLRVERDEAGQVRSVGPSAEGGDRESIVHCEVSRVSDPEHLARIEGSVRERLEAVVLATDDFPAMVDALNDRVAELAERSGDLPERAEEFREIQDFLRWIRDGGFVLLGFRSYSMEGEGEDAVIRVDPGSGLGILRDESTSTYAEAVRVADLSAGLRELAIEGPTLIITKTNAESPVHRRARMDYIGIKRLSPEGRVVGEHRFLGLFTSKAYGEHAEQIPILREKLRSILQGAGAQQGSHDYKEIITIFNSMAKEELFLTSAEEIGADVQTVLQSYLSADVIVTLREDPLRRGASVMVILPKERFSGEVRRRIEEAFVSAFRGPVLNYHLALGTGDQARLHFHMGSTAEDIARVDPAELRRIIAQIIRTWSDQVRSGLEHVRPADEARRLAARYDRAFGPEYKAATRPETSVKDILELEAMAVDGRAVSIAFGDALEIPGQADLGKVTELVVFLRDQRLILSEFMPILENVGLRVVAVNPYPLEGEGTGPASIYVFQIQDADGLPLDQEAVGQRLADTILAVRSGDASDDSLNSLVLSAGLTWREVEILRTYANYGFQLGAVPSRFSFSAALKKYPGIGASLVRLFHARFDPGAAEDMESRKEKVGACLKELARQMREVNLLADDRALQRLRILMESTVRTNFFRGGGIHPTRRSGGVPYISLKLDARKLQPISAVRTRLLYEVWVRSPRMEGVHLRGARVARGGIRWSDRPDDFRTEVLGLVKTQMVKNAVIVPGGSKGGFVTLRSFADREAMGKEAEEQYKTLVRGLLDLTDNVEGRTPVHPPETVIWDEPDPYLVVAADKGTARFSDVANGVAREYGFWLDDAFASGGSNGYDHKVVGITARGGWECVKRHFREAGKDIQTEPFTVVGIGDMSGDVFGNGMLLSRQIRLLAAFNHLHIFVDPDPDPATSFAERERLFALGRSTWEDYDPAVLSPGGFIVPRASKEVPLTPEAREALAIPDEVESLDGESLIRHILMAPAELLWNGGIGTYVKSTLETHAEVGDAANDSVRVDADELRVQVVGEGGNLGLTQDARIQFALAGGRINTDAMDNSGGVDMSDREVNLKVLLSQAVQEGTLTMEARNDLLEELTEAEVQLVLKDNESQSLAVSLDEIRLSDRSEEFVDLMLGLEKEGLLDRASEQLPSLESLEERLDEFGQSFTRPELCVLLAYAKLHLKGEILRSAIPDDAATESYLRGYFPADALRTVGDGALGAHGLRREIIASQLTNDLVDIMGSAFVHRVTRDTGVPAAEVARAWLIAARLAGHTSILERFREARGGTPALVMYRWFLGLGRVLERTTRWVLSNIPPEEPTARCIEQRLDGLSTLRQRFPELVTGHERERFQELVDELTATGAPEEVARGFITLRFLDQLLEILAIARESGAPVEDTARAYYRIAHSFQTGWLRHAILAAPGDDRWSQRAAQALHNDVAEAHKGLVIRLLDRNREITLPPEAGREGTGVSGWGRDLDRYRDLMEEVQEDGPSLLALSAVVRDLQALANRPV